MGGVNMQYVGPVVGFTTNDEAESTMAHEMLCFTLETVVGGHEGRRSRTGGCGHVRAMFALCPRWFVWAGNVMVVQTVCGAVLGGSAFKELQIVL